MHLTVLALALSSAPASAEVYYEKWLGSVGSVSMETDTADATLFHAPTGETAPFVQVTIGEDNYLFALMTNSKTIWISDRVAKDQGLKFASKNKKLVNLKGKDNKFKELGEIKVAQVDAMTIGGLVLEDLGVSNFKKQEAETDAAQGGRAWYKSHISGLSVDGAIGNFTTLSVGDHLITATVTDSNGASSSDTINLSVFESTAPQTYSLAVTWSAPEQRADGSQLAAQELAGYRINWNNDTNGESGSLLVQDGTATSYQIDNLNAGSYRLSLNTIDINGLVSSNSTDMVVELN